MIIWGISAGGHDAALSVIKDGQITWASHSERFSRKKNDPRISYRMVTEAKTFGDPDLMVWHEKPFLKRTREIYARQWSDAFGPGPREMLKITGYKDTPLRFVSHHHSHAAGGYFTSGFPDAAIIVVDAIGEWETLSVWKGDGNSLTKIRSASYPNSLGLFYSAMTQRCGFKPNEEEYIMMGMAAHGDPHRYEGLIEKELLQPTDEFPFFRCRLNLHRGIMAWQPDITDTADLAAAAQKIFTKVMGRLSLWASKVVGSGNLVLSGGCALNCVTNAAIARTRRWNNIWIMPNPGDAGNSLGAALAHHGDMVKWTGPYLGHEISGHYPIHGPVSELLEKGVVGIANGRAEFGPRALGNRSLFADPRMPDIRDRLNLLKKREPFRPFAPVILAEFYGDYFEDQRQNTSYMQFAVRCKKRHRYPGICNVDGTSRVQTIRKRQNPGLYRMLTEWYSKTGCPMLVNTSLNIKGQPIVNDEVDAMHFESTYGIRVFCR